VVIVAGLANRAFQVEIEAVAVVPSGWLEHLRRGVARRWLAPAQRVAGRRRFGRVP
jgi:hypothetical protein